MSKESDMEIVMIDRKKPRLKPSMVHINDLYSTPVRKVTSSWCTSNSTSLTSFQLPTVTMPKLWNHHQLSTTLSCNNPGSNYITDYNDDPITVPPTVLESKISMAIDTLTVNQYYKIQTSTKCPMIIHLIMNIIFDKSWSGINYSDNNF